MVVNEAMALLSEIIEQTLSIEVALLTCQQGCTYSIMSIQFNLYDCFGREKYVVEDKNFI